MFTPTALAAWPPWVEAPRIGLYLRHSAHSLPLLPMPRAAAHPLAQQPPPHLREVLAGRDLVLQQPKVDLDHVRLGAATKSLAG